MKILKNRLSRKTTTSKQKIFVQSFEGIGDILVYETKRQKNKLVQDGLQKISDLIKEVFEIEKNDLKRFKQIMFSKNFFELYKKDKTEAILCLDFDSEKYLTGFLTPINQIVRVYEAAISSQNEEISRFAVYNINWVLAVLSSRKNNELFIKQILRKLSEISRIAVQRNDVSVYAAAIYWYVDIVFNKLGKEANFKIIYLNLFDDFFFSIVKYIVSENQTSIFKSLVKSLVDGIHIRNISHGAVWKYAQLLLVENPEKSSQLDQTDKIQQKASELEGSVDELFTLENLNKWLSKFEVLKNILEPVLSNEQMKIASTLEQEIRDSATSEFKYQNLLEIVFAVGAYCLFNQKYPYIKYLWEYNQPPDSDSIWIGHEIIPNSLDGVVQFYYRKGLFDRKFDFWEDHRGSEKYFKQYFLLLLLRVLNKIPFDTEGKYQQIENFRLPGHHVNRLSDIEHSIDTFFQLSDELKKSANLLFEIGIEPEKSDVLFEAKLIPFLNKLKGEAGRQIVEINRMGKISQKKVEEFKEGVLKGFDEATKLRDIFKDYLETYENRVKEKNVSIKNCFRINTIDHKAAFFDEWHIQYHGWGENYGRELAEIEDTYLLDKISAECKEIQKDEFVPTLEKFKNPDNIIIFTTSIGIYRFFEESNRYVPKWKKGTEQITVGSFIGWYEFKQLLIPVFHTFHHRINKQILILDKTKIGKLIQLTPLTDEDDANKLKDIFYINIQAFSEDEKLMQEFLKNPPVWLRNYGEESKQKEMLLERVLVQIFEKFEYKKSDDFEGYRLMLKE